jgi:putative MATE family efflux protein
MRTPRTRAAATGRFAHLREAITGGSIRKTLLVLALPVFGEQLLNSFVAVCDIFLAGQLSKETTAAVGLASYVEWLASMLFALVGTGTTALVARCVGAKDDEGANRFTNQSITLSVLIGVVIAAGLFALAPVFGRLQGMTGVTYDMTVKYLRIDAGALIFTSITLVGAAALRGAGDTRTPMKILGSVNVLNAAVSAALVFGVGPLPRLGFMGIVLGTVVGRVAGGLLMLAVLARGRGGLQIRWSALGLQKEPTRRVLRIGGPAASDGAVMWTAQFIFLMIIARLAAGDLGTAYYAAHMIGVRLEAFTYLPATAWAAAAATMIGQNLGAHQPDRARRAGHEAALQCGLLSATVGVLFLIGANGIFTLMHKDPLVREVGVTPFRLVACFQPMLAISIVYVGALRGAGDTRFPLVATTLGQTLVRLPLAYLFGIVLHAGLFGAWAAMCTDFVVRGVIVATHFARGKWIKLQI